MIHEVTVILPTYNSARTIPALLEAVRAQTFRDFALCVCDDGSTDDVDHIVRRFSADAPEVSVSFLGHGHGGVSSTRNLGLAFCKSPYVAFLDSDDLPGPDWLETLVAGIQGADLSVCGYEVHDERGAALYDTTLRAGELDPGPDGFAAVPAADFVTDLFSNRLMYQGYVWNKLFRRELIERDEPVRYPRGIAYNEDRYFIYDYLKRCESVRVSMRPCFTYNSHPAPAGYVSRQATELGAFADMIDDIRSFATPGSPHEQTLFYAEKDFFRALVELFTAAHAAGDPDAIWIGEQLADDSLFEDEFSDYPEAFQRMVHEAVATAARERLA